MIFKIVLKPFASLLARVCGIGRSELVVIKDPEASYTDVYIVVGLIENLSVEYSGAKGYVVKKIGTTSLLLTATEFDRARQRFKETIILCQNK